MQKSRHSVPFYFPQNGYASSTQFHVQEKAPAQPQKQKPKLGAGFGQVGEVMPMMSHVQELQKQGGTGEQSGSKFTLHVYVEDRVVQKGPFLLVIYQPARVTVKILKWKAQRDWNIPMQLQRWILGGKIADENASLSDFYQGTGGMAFLCVVAPNIKATISRGHKTGSGNANFGANPSVCPTFKLILPKSNTSDTAVLRRKPAPPTPSLEDPSGTANTKVHSYPRISHRLPKNPSKRADTDLSGQVRPRARNEAENLNEINLKDADFEELTREGEASNENNHSQNSLPSASSASDMEFLKIEPPEMVNLTSRDYKEELKTDKVTILEDLAEIFGELLQTFLEPTSSPMTKDEIIPEPEQVILEAPEQDVGSIFVPNEYTAHSATPEATAPLREGQRIEQVQEPIRVGPTLVEEAYERELPEEIESEVNLGIVSDQEYMEIAGEEALPAVVLVADVVNIKEKVPEHQRSLKATEPIRKENVNPLEAEDATRIVVRGDVYADLLAMAGDPGVIAPHEPFNCPICFMTTEPREGIVLRNCLHMFCRDCITGVVTNQETAQITCPYIDENYSCTSILEEREIKATVPDEIYERYLGLSVKLAELTMMNSFHCLTTDCKGWCILEGNVTSFHCPVCNQRNCISCNAIHNDVTCDEYQASLRVSAASNEDTETSLKMLEELIRKGEALDCPSCHVVLLKKWGCDWVRCSYCKTEICWITKGFRWGPNGKGDTSGGCKCGINGVKCHPKCTYCH